MKLSLLPILATVLLSALLAAPVLAEESKDVLKKRFEDRYPALLSLKREGKIGETWQGWVEAVKTEYTRDEKVRDLVADENHDRKELYAILAKEHNTTPDEIAGNNAKRNFQKAEKGAYLKPPDGVWRQK